MPIDVNLTGVWMGQPGNLAPIPNAVGDLSHENERISNIQTAINGARTVQYAPLVRRSWSVKAPGLTPVERGTVEGLYRMGGYPWALATIDGWLHNLLTPDATLFKNAAGTVAGRVQIPPDHLRRIPAMIAPNRLVLGSYTYAVIGEGLALPDVPVTASVWAKRWLNQASWLSLDLIDAAGSVIANSTVSSGSAEWYRLTTTATPPAGTVWARMSVAGSEVAAPAITWTPAVTEWTLGVGCQAVMPSPPAWSLNGDYPEARWDLSMTLTELG